MLESKNKSTGDYLSITPEFTYNTSLSWQTTDDRRGRSAAFVFQQETVELFVQLPILFFQVFDIIQ